MFVWMALKADDDGVGSAKGNTVSYDIGSNRLRYRKQIVRQCLSAVQLYGITRSLCQLKYSQLLHNCTKKNRICLHGTVCRRYRLLQKQN